MDARVIHAALVGLPASGKSTVGRELAALLGLAFFDLDELVEAEAGMAVSAIFAAEGEAGFRARESRALETVASGIPCVLATGGGAVLRAGNRIVLKRCFAAVWLRVSLEAAAARASVEPDSRPLLSGDPSSRLRELAAAREPLYAQVAFASVETDGREIRAIARDIERILHGKVYSAS